MYQINKRSGVYVGIREKSAALGFSGKCELIGTRRSRRCGTKILEVNWKARLLEEMPFSATHTSQRLVGELRECRWTKILKLKSDGLVRNQG